MDLILNFTFGCYIISLIKNKLYIWPIKRLILPNKQPGDIPSQHLYSFCNIKKKKGIQKILFIILGRVLPFEDNAYRESYLHGSPSLIISFFRLSYFYLLRTCKLQHWVMHSTLSKGVLKKIIKQINTFYHVPNCLF